METDLPFEIYLKIAEIATREDFRTLAGLMTISKTAYMAATSKGVLLEANLSAFGYWSNMILTTSPFRCFFVKCFEAGNNTANYLEALRVRYIEYDVMGALAILDRGNTKTCPVNMYIRSMLLINAGYLNEGMWAINPTRWWENIAFVDEIGTHVITAIRNMNPRGMQSFWPAKFFYPPSCMCKGADFGKCVACFIWFNAKQMTLSH